jgi:uncharacterized C2H2 Zn-finger protein
MKPDKVQLEFRCPECGASGLTPEMPEDKAIAVILKDLRMRCPRCSAIIEATESLGRAMWQTRVRKAQESLQEALKSKLQRRAQKEKRKEPGGGQHPI